METERRATSGTVMRVGVGSEAAFTHTAAQPIFEARMPPMSPLAVSRDGSRFLILNGIEPDVSTPLTLVVSWDASLKK